MATMTTCPECGNKVAKDNLKAHQRRVHGGEGPRPRGPQRNPAPSAAQGFPWIFVGVGLVVAILVSAALYYVVFATPAGDGGGGGGSKTVADVVTSYGTFVMELYTVEAPITTGSFISHADSHHFDGSTFHRIVAGFVIQGGQLAGGVSNPSVYWEDMYSKGFRNNDKYTVAMARSGNSNDDAANCRSLGNCARDTATSQFFVNVGNNANLDKPSQTYPYVVFGKVIEGTSVVDAIAGAPVNGETPVSTITINSITIRTMP